ncbi:hypothetical protein [Acidithiobacillus ferrivorans]|nr:hypothetical protein [Acidithiobacillus ferrivorans]MBU2851679.1 hypothetical protein [Acidithiobacillus ferrivorans]
MGDATTTLTDAASVGYRPFDRIASYYEAAPPQVDRTAAIRMEKPL